MLIYFLSKLLSLVYIINNYSKYLYVKIIDFDKKINYHKNKSNLSMQKNFFF